MWSLILMIRQNVLVFYANNTGQCVSYSFDTLNPYILYTLPWFNNWLVMVVYTVFIVG